MDTVPDPPCPVAGWASRGPRGLSRGRAGGVARAALHTIRAVR